MGIRSGPLDVLIVGWYPGADDPIAGRFVADQAAALAGTGRVRPWVASFEPFWLHGDRWIRGSAASTWPRGVEAAARAGLVPTASGAFSPATVPVARLGTPGGTAPGIGGDNEAVHRERALAAALRGMRRPVDLVHGHVGYPEGAAAARIAARLGVPFVLTEHATYLARILADPVHRARYREAGLAARRIIAVGRMLAEQIAGELPELADRLVVIPNTVDVAAFPLVGPAARDGDELLWVGYRREVKGTGTLLRAFARVRAARPATTLRLVGRSATDEDEAGWHSLAGELGVADAVRFDPPADRAGVVAAMSRAGVFVHPGTRETFGMVAVEALASGLPVVATDSGGVTEVLADDPDALGALVPRSDPEALATAILRTLDRRATFDPSRLRTHVEVRYAASVVAGRIADVYDEVLAAARASARWRGGPSSPPDDGGAVEVPTMPAHPVLVAFDRPQLDRVLARCPRWLLDGLVVVTRGGDVPGAAATVCVEAERDGALLTLLGRRTTGSPLPSPVRWLRRLRAQSRLKRAVLPALADAVARGMSTAGPMRAAAAAGEGDPRPLLLCLGGIDVAVAGGLVRTGRARLAPGGLRWLGDIRWAAGIATVAEAGSSEVAAATAEGGERDSSPELRDESAEAAPGC